MTTLHEGLNRLYLAAKSTQLPLFVGGSVAAMFYGEPRSTLDIDLVVQASTGDAQRLVNAFPADRFYVPPLEAVRAELRRSRGGLFNVIDLDSGLKADIYLAGDDPLIEFGLAHAVTHEVGTLALTVAPATYVVVMKLRYYAMNAQDKHLRDIRSLLHVSLDSVDLGEVESWVNRLGIGEAWSRCRKEEPPED